MRDVIDQLQDVFGWDHRQLNTWLAGWTAVENVAQERPTEVAYALGLEGDVTSRTLRRRRARKARKCPG
jgi:hypothetical protein